MSREAILAAARTKFAQLGYEGASIRAIAQAAGVDGALVHHFFGTKEGLFAAAVQDAIRAEAVVDAVVSGGPEGVGERLARAYLGLWEDTEGRERLSGIMRSAMSHPAAAQLLREFITDRVLVPIGRALGGPHPEVRAVLAGSQLVGIAFTRYLVQMQPIAALSADEVVACVAPTLQRYLTEPLPVP